MLIVGSALLTSTLVSAKAAFHRAVIHKSDTAMSDATAQFAAWAQNYVSKYGTEAAWPSGMQPQSGPISEDLCTGKVLSATTSTQPGTPSTGSTCPLMATMEWTVTGSSATPTSHSAPTAATSIAQNLSVSLDEQRISATLTVIITSPSGRTVFANHSREVTARIFDALPYVAVTGTRDVSTEAGTVHASEGDTGGYHGSASDQFTEAVPTENHPSWFNDTRIVTTIDCSNSTSNRNQSSPTADGNAVYFDRSRRTYGNLAWVFETPCAPKYQIDTTGAPTDFQSPRGSIYGTDAGSTEPWHKSDQNVSAYSQ
ncbi:MAG: hypothetical protein GIW94_12660 [Candidatus Eremiobacteraeota bacterium]|nr:hypothetical protein [Candidatus Eremiobacteraeota bacterium]MBC5822243.1 hypothetical protein [Candidatus Eremiobacteraeota bacterium]